MIELCRIPDARSGMRQWSIRGGAATGSLTLGCGQFCRAQVGRCCRCCQSAIRGGHDYRRLPVAGSATRRGGG